MKRFVFTFRSSSSPGKTYEAIKCVDELPRQPGRYRETVIQLSCNCPGWTRRVQADGSRMCVHTRLIQSGNPEKDPLFVSCVPPLNSPPIDIPYPTQGYAERERLSWFWFADIPSRFRDELRGRMCRKCTGYHFPENLKCDGEAWRVLEQNRPLLRMPAPQVGKDYVS